MHRVGKASGPTYDENAIGELLLRVALLSLLERELQDRTGTERSLAPDQSEPRGYLRVAGHSVIRHQMALAFALGCARIIVLSEILSAQLSELQELAEERGVQFHVLAASRSLVSLIAPEDDLIVLGDGLLTLPHDALERINEGQGVLVLPVESGLPAGFERIDINSAWGGVMHVPGRIAAGLGDLPGDWNAPSALLRLAMQAGVRQVPIPAGAVESGRWTIIRSEAEAHALEPRWLRLHTTAPNGRSPGEGLAAALVHWLGPALLHAGTRPSLVLLAAFLLALLGLGSGWLGVSGPGFMLLALAWLAQRTARLLARIDRDSLLRPAPWFNPETLFVGGLDAMFIVMCSWRSAVAQASGNPAGLSLFAPIVLFALLRLAPRILGPTKRGKSLGQWLEDRFVTGGALALASLAGPFDAVVMFSVLFLLVALLYVPQIKSRQVPNRVLTKDI